MSKRVIKRSLNVLLAVFVFFSSVYVSQNFYAEEAGESTSETEESSLPSENEKTEDEIIIPTPTAESSEATGGVATPAPVGSPSEGTGEVATPAPVGSPSEGIGEVATPAPVGTPSEGIGEVATPAPVGTPSEPQEVTLSVSLEQKYISEEEANTLEMFWGPYLKVNFDEIPEGITVTNINVAIAQAGDLGGFDTDYSYDDVVDGVLWTEAPCDSHYTVTVSYHTADAPETTETVVLEEDVTLTADNIEENEPSTFYIGTGSISIESSKTSSESSPWVYYEDSGLLTYTVNIERDDSLPDGTIRNITIDTNPFNNAFTDCYYIKEYPNTLNIQIRGFSLASDKQSVTYQVNNSAIPDSGLKISIALATSLSTIYYVPAGTPAQSIGLWLLKDPNQRLGASVVDATQTPDENDTVEIFLKKDFNQEDYLSKSSTTFLKTAAGDDTSYQAGDVVLGVDGYFHPDNTPTNSQSTYLRFYLSDEIHVPVGNLNVKIPLPAGFKASSCVKDETNGYNYEYITLGSNGLLNGTDLALGRVYSPSNYQLATSLNSAQVAQFAGSYPANKEQGKQWFSIRVTGNSSYAPQAENPIYTYDTPGKITGDNILVQYQQIEKKDDGTYQVVNKRIDLGKISVTIPEFKFEKRFNATVGTPVKVNEDDEDDTSYRWSVTNSYDSTQGDVTNNTAPIPYRNGLFEIEIPKEFAPESISGFNSLYFSSYHYVYEDGTSSSERNVSATIYPTPNASGSRVAKVVYKITDRGLVTNLATFSNSFSMTGKFSEPDDGDEIKMPVTVKNDDEANPQEQTKEIVWKYKAGVDNLVFGATHRSYGSAETYPYFLNNSEGESNVFTDFYFTSNYGSTNDEKTSSSIKYKDFTIDFSSNPAALLELITGSVIYKGSTAYYRLYGDTYFEITTSVNSTPKKIYFDASSYQNVNLGLAPGEYLKSIKFHADYLKLLASNDPAAQRSIFSFQMRNDRNIPSGLDSLNSIEETVKYNELKGVVSAQDHTFSEQVGTSERSTATDKWYICFNKELDINAMTDTSLRPVDVTNTAARSSVLSGTVSVYNPIFRDEFTNTNAGVTLYPDGTKMYLELNSTYFKYVGQSKYISTQTINGKTYVVVDLSGQEIPKSYNGVIPFRTDINTSSAAYTFPDGSFMANPVCEDKVAYQLFNSGYIDIGPALNSDGTIYPFIKYTPDDTYFNASVDNDNLTVSSGVTYTEKRIVPLNVTSSTTVVAASIDNVYLYPGLDITDPASTVIKGIRYKADQYNRLVLTLSISSSEKNYKDYYLAIELPTKGVTTENMAGEKGTSANSLRLRDANSVHIPDVFADPTVKYCSAFTFDKDDFTSSSGTCTEETDPTKAKYVYIYIPYVHISTDGNIQLDLTADEADMYSLADGSIAYANAEAKFFEQLPNAEPSSRAGMADGKNLGKFIFEWYEMSGRIFVDSVNKIPNGLFNRADGDFTSWNYQSVSYMRFKDYGGSNRIFNLASFSPTTGIYTVKIQPNKTAYDLAFDLKNGSTNYSSYYYNKYRISTNTSSNTDKYNNNNMRRQLNEQTSGMNVTANVDGFTGSADVTNEEIQKGWVNVGLYQNPSLSFSAANVRVKEGKSDTWTATIVGVGKFKSNAPDEFVHITDEGTYGTFEKTYTSNSNTIQIKIDGLKETLSGTSLITKNVDYDCLNYFDEDFTGTNTYQVYVDPYVVFDKGVVSGKTTAWTDAWKVSANSSEQIQKEISTLASSTAIYGKMKASDVPVVVAPEGYCFAGWKITRYGAKGGTSNVGIQDPTTQWIYKYDLLTAQYEVDVIGKPGGGGDGIPDKYQTVFRFKTTAGGMITKNSTTIYNQTDYFEVIKTKLKSHVISALYPVEETNPSNWSETANFTFTAADVPTAANKTNYEFEDWKVTASDNAAFKMILADNDDVVTFGSSAGSSYKGAPKIFTITAEFTTLGFEVTFLKNEAGQASQVTESITKDADSKLTGDDLKDTLGHVRSTAAYGYTFTGWKRVDGHHDDSVGTTDALLMSDHLITEAQTLQPQYSKKQYTVNWAIADATEADNKKDGYGNSISYAGQDAKQIDFNSTGENLTVPTVTLSTQYDSLFSFAYWSYEMECDTTAAGCPADGVAKGSTTAPKDLVITGNTTFTAVFAAKPYVGIVQDGNGTVANEWMQNPATEPTLTYAANVTAIQLHNPPMATQPVAGQFNVLAGFKSNTNYEVDTIVAKYVNEDHSETDPGSLVVYANGTVNSDNITTLQTDTGNSTISITAESSSTPGKIKVVNIGSNNGTVPCGIIFEVSYKLVQRKVTFDPKGGTISTTNNDFTGAGGVLPGTSETNATWTVDHGEKVTLFPKVEKPAKKAFSYWALSTTPTTPVTEAALANTPVTADITYIAVFDDDIGGPNGEGDTCGDGGNTSCEDGVPDKYQIKFTYVSKDTNLGTVSGTTVEYITRKLNLDGTYSTTNEASPAVNVTTTAVNGDLYGFKEWQWGATPDTAISNSALKKKTFTTSTEFKADWKRVGYSVYYLIDSADGTLVQGTFIKDSNTKVHEDVTVGSSSADTPTVTITDENKQFVGWYQTTDTSKTLVDPTSFVVENADLSFTAKVLGNTVTVEDGIVLTGEGFTIENSEAAPITKDKVIINAGSESWLVATPDTKLSPTISDADLAKIQAVGPEGDIVPVTLISTTTIDDREYMVTRDIVVVVKGVTTPTPSGPDANDEYLAISAKGFSMTNAEAKVYDETAAKTNSSVDSYLVKSSVKVTAITADSNHMDIIKNVGVDGGIFDQKFTSVSGTLTATTTVAVAVEGTHTTVVVAGEDKLAIHANGFTVANADAISLTADLSKTKSDVLAKFLVKNETLNLADISVDVNQLKTIQDADEKGGIFPLTFTARKDGYEASVTVDVVVLGTEVISEEDDDSIEVVIKASDFTIPNIEKNISEADALLKAIASGMIVSTGVDITDELTADATQLAAIHEAPKEGGIYPLTIRYTYQDSDGQTVVVEKVIQVTVLPISAPPTPTTPEEEEVIYTPGTYTCAEIYGEGWEWNNREGVCKYNPDGYYVPNTSDKSK